MDGRLHTVAQYAIVQFDVILFYVYFYVLAFLLSVIISGADPGNNFLGELVHQNNISIVIIYRYFFHLQF